MLSGLRVIRFGNTGLREKSELAFCMPTETAIRVIYSDREVECSALELASSLQILDMDTLLKAHVLAAVESDFEKLRAKLPAHGHVFLELEAFWSRAQAFQATLNPVRRPRTILPTPRLVNTCVTDAIDKFTNECEKDDMRLSSIVDNISKFRKTSQAWMPTSWNKTRPDIKGMQPIDLHNVTTMRKASALCRKQELEPPKGFVKSHSFHYGKYNKNTLVSLLSISVMNLNKTPGSVAISVDIAASTDKHHSMSIAIDSLKKIMRKRRNKCVLFAQVANTTIARTFWKGKMTQTKRASLMTALFSNFDDRYKIYYDANDMALFFE